MKGFTIPTVGSQETKNTVLEKMALEVILLEAAKHFEPQPVYNSTIVTNESTSKVLLWSIFQKYS